ncbi:LipL32 family surface lipoprotein [Pseudoalteromonas piratica]|uniref:Major outer membrane protein n=1 Tax=Pseudoalteromonas piratica TaxID=1348114 RepID=A0A0A7EDQ9_9GAMM|nr:LipL32 family surface lipoprotein [Pseudoalteromonas piratica]AIY64206.1 major outer membrane protein [Pseudoalteromonas piratica]
MFKKALLIVSSTIALGACVSSGGPALKSSVSQSVAGVEARLPYANYTNYFGYVDASVKPEGKYKNKDAYYLYAWVPAAVDEIGVSMVSPATSTPADSDFVNANYTKNYGSDSKTFFDTYLVLDRMDIIDPAKIKNGGKSLQTLTYNDDSSELPQNPGGQSYNSLLRQTSDVNNPTKALVRGVYRISFTSFRSAVEGSFEATVGTNVPGVKIAASLEELHNLVNEG